MQNQQIGEYKILGTLGEGGFGLVHKAVSSTTGTQVAIKVLHRESLGNEKVVKKFFHEAMILARLDHPNITRLYEFFPDGNAYAIVMEFIEGTTLKDMIVNHDGPIPYEKALNICLQILAAFEYAHDNGIIHRDIKPGNIMIDKNGVVKIMDFGIAKFSSAASAETRTTWKWGAPHYMAPERFQEDGEMDVRSDIYSLGIVFYEAFTGRKPFDSSDTIRVIFCHLNEPPINPSTLLENLPPHVSTAILKALEKEPDNRFSSCAEFASALAGEEGDLKRSSSRRAKPDDSTLILDETSIKKARQKKAAKPEREKPAKPRKKLPLHYLVGLCILGILILIAPFVADDILVFFRPAPGDMQPGTFKNPLGFKELVHPADKRMMVEIPAGEFTMGSDMFEGEKPVQRILLASYFIDKLPVTNADFARFVEETGYTTQVQERGFGWVREGMEWQKTTGAFWRMPDGVNAVEDEQMNLPVTQISHKDAEAYCRWAGKALPTEAQWEKAARGPDGRIYPWDNAMPTIDLAHFGQPLSSLPWPVGKTGSSSQSHYGVRDMAGNVYQWTKDWYAPHVRNYQNPKGPETGSEKVVKGGAFVEGPLSLRSSHRDRYPPDFSSNLFGLRCVCDSVPLHTAANP
jgi:serine/threonine-protein kinase